MQPVGVLETAKATNPLKDLLKFGQSVWLDYIRRDLLTGGELKRSEGAATILQMGSLKPR